MSLDKELVAASAEPLVLSILAKGESYGYEILKTITILSSEKLKWSEGMLYPVLHRLEKNKCIEASWKKSESGRKRKYYKITKTGLKHLADKKAQWELAYETLNHSLGGLPHEG